MRARECQAVTAARVYLGASTYVLSALSEDDVTRFWGLIDVRGPEECWPFRAAVAAGRHGFLNIKGRRYRAHALALALEVGPPPKAGTVCRHSCDYPPCCNPAHLAWGTYKQNTQDAVARGRMHRWNGERAGSRNPFAKLSEADVHLIRSRYAPAKRMAEQLGVTVTTINSILAGKSWTHLLAHQQA